MCLPELLLHVFNESCIDRIQIVWLTSVTLYLLLVITTVAFTKRTFLNNGMLPSGIKKFSHNVKQFRLALSYFLHLKSFYTLDEYFNSTKVQDLVLIYKYNYSHYSTSLDVLYFYYNLSSVNYSCINIFLLQCQKILI